MGQAQKLTTIKRQLLKLVLVAILPIFLFAVGLFGYVALQHVRALEMSLKGTTRALSAAVEEQISSIASSLSMLAIVEDFEDASLKDLHRRLRRFVNTNEGWSSIGIASLDGNQVFSTLVGYNESLSSWADQEFFQEILRTGRPTFSGHRVGKVTHQNVFSVAVPVRVNRQLKYILVATVNSVMLANQLRDQKLPETWTASIVDKNGLIIARSRDQEKFAGTKTTEVLGHKLTQTDNSFFEDFTKDGTKAFGAFNKLHRIGWTVVLGMPYSESQLPATRSLWLLIVGGVGLLILGIILSQIISRRISLAIIGLSSSARSLGRGESPRTLVSDLFEVNEVAEALENASRELHHADETQRELYAKAQSAIELRDTFLSVASHELKTPLTTINLQAQLIKRIAQQPEKISPEKLDLSLARILGQLRRLTRLIDDLLDISRINAGKLEINKEKMDVVLLTREVVAQFEVDLKGSHIRIIGEESILGNFDRDRMEQVITNLISNAIKYGGGNPIEVTLTADDGSAVISVKDHGIGIAPENHQKIFERFERMVKNSDISGLGLGLWIVKRIVDQLQGTITVHSEGLGKGTVFTLIIPTEL